MDAGGERDPQEALAKEMAKNPPKYGPMAYGLYVVLAYGVWHGVLCCGMAHGIYGLYSMAYHGTACGMAYAMAYGV